jgi:hypothetical protein
MPQNPETKNAIARFLSIAAQAQEAHDEAQNVRRQLQETSKRLQALALELEAKATALVGEGDKLLRDCQDRQVLIEGVVYRWKKQAFTVVRNYSVLGTHAYRWYSLQDIV